MLNQFLVALAATAGAILLMAAILHALPRLGPPGRALAAWLCRAPGLDLLITYFTALPLILGPVLAGWMGLAGAAAGQIAGVVVWTLLHEAAHSKVRRGPRINKVINSRVGWLGNHAALWWMVWGVPIFWFVRLGQYWVYPVLVLLIGLPRYNQGEWVNVSRQKFRGLIGHDLIWCLYCDWMTGIWSIGSEMLRNIESLWCPIRFDSEKKCANCRVDFPDVAEWVPAGGSIEDAAALVERMYPPGVREKAWFGHAARLTVDGRDRRG